MTLKDIIAIKGKGELFRVLSKSPKGIIVETLNEKHVRYKVQPNLQVLVLNDITIYPNDNNDIHLYDIFRKIYEKDKLSPSIDNNSNPESIIQFFKELAPNYDEERVYLSDMKKMLKWYKNIAEFYPVILEELKIEEQADEKQEEVNKPVETTIEESPKEEISAVAKEKKPKSTPKKKVSKTETKE